MKKLNGFITTPVGIAISHLIEKLPICRFSSPDNCKKELLRFLGNDHLTDEGLLRYAIESRKREIQWIWLYIPSILFGLMMLYILRVGLIVTGSKYPVYCLFILVALAIIFRITFYMSYEDCCKKLVFAANDLLKDLPILGKNKKDAENSGKAGAVMPGNPTFLQEEMPALQAMPIQQEARAGRVVADAVKPEETIKKTVYGEALLPLFKEAGKAVKYGRITIFLLDQLIRRECKQPSVFDEPVINIPESTEILGCKAKNIGSKFHAYYSREAIKLGKNNSKTTHKKYLKTLQQHYQKCGDLILYDQARDLESFLSSIKIERKKGKMHLPS